MCDTNFKNGLHNNMFGFGNLSNVSIIIINVDVYKIKLTHEPFISKGVRIFDIGENPECSAIWEE